MDDSLENIFRRLRRIEVGEVQCRKCQNSPKQERVLEGLLDDGVLPDAVICWYRTQGIAGDGGKVMEQFKVCCVQVVAGDGEESGG